MVLEMLGFQATAAATTGTAGTAFTNDSLTVRNFTPGTKAFLLAAWSRQQTDGMTQVVWPSANDTTRNIRWVSEAAFNIQGVPWGAPIPMRSQDLISATIFGTAVAGDIEQAILAMYYEDMPGLMGRYLHAKDLMARGVRQVTVQASIDTGTAGNWSGAELITADSDLLRGNTDYALLGANIEESCCALGIRAPDWSNVRVAVPFNPSNERQSSGFFVGLSQAYDMPLIPIFNSANKGGIFLDASHDENDVTVEVSLNLLELSDSAVR